MTSDEGARIAGDRLARVGAVWVLGGGLLAACTGSPAPAAPSASPAAGAAAVTTAAIAAPPTVATAAVAAPPAAPTPPATSVRSAASTATATATGDAVAASPAAPPAAARPAVAPGGGGMPRCLPTPPDALGPFYQPNAPERDRVGTGYVLSGNVRQADTCKGLVGARLEFWLANPAGEYDDAHRATVIAGPEGAYRFESNVPVAYAGRPPHIHIRVSAPGHQTLVTQHYSAPNVNAARLELVLATG